MDVTTFILFIISIIFLFFILKKFFKISIVICILILLLAIWQLREGNIDNSVFLFVLTILIYFIDSKFNFKKSENENFNSINKESSTLYLDEKQNNEEVVKPIKEVLKSCPNCKSINSKKLSECEYCDTNIVIN